MSEPEAIDSPTANQKQLTTGRLVSISAFWLGTNVHWTALLLILLPLQVATLAGQHQAEALGSVIGIGALLFALVVPLVIGPLSDRCTSRLGRRRPYMFVGVGINVAGLVAMLAAFQAQNFAGYLVGYMIVQLGNNVATGAYQGVIPDMVPPDQRGVASGYMGLMTQLGSLVGAVAVGMYFSKNAVASTVLLIAFLVGCLAWTATGLKEKPLDKKPPAVGFAEFIKALWIDPRKYPDFAWVWITRALVMFGFYSVQPFLLYYLRDMIHVPQADLGKTQSIVFGLVLVAATTSGFFGGWLSDRVGRKVIVYASNAIMAVMAVGLVFCGSLPQALVVGVMFGIGYGAYISVDWALGTDVLPNKQEAGKDMAVWHIAMVFPQALSSPVAGKLLEQFGSTTEKVGKDTIVHYTSTGYLAIFSMAAASLALGALLLRNVRGAR